MWNLDTLKSLVRAVLKIGGGYLLARGLADGSQLLQVVANRPNGARLLASCSELALV